MARIAMVNAPFYSHAGAMARLAGVLVHQGHEVIVWGPEANRQQIEAFGARFEPHAPKLPTKVKGLALAAGLAATTERIAESLIAQLHSHGVELLVRDNQTTWALVAGDYLGLPTVVSHPMFPLAGPGALPAKVRRAAAAARESEADKQAAREQFDASWLSIARRWGVEIGDINGVFHRTSEPTMAYTTEEIVGENGLPTGWSCIGPLLAPGPTLQHRAEPPLVYACFGTSYNFRADLFRAVIDALGGRRVEVLISTGKGKVKPASLEPLPENVEIREFVPAREVLARASVHITHGGCNSVHESLLAAVPMVCLPQAFDQFPLSERVEQLGVGLNPGEGPAEIRDAVQGLLATAKARERARELREHLRNYDGEARVAAVIEGALAESAVIGG